MCQKTIAVDAGTQVFIVSCSRLDKTSSRRLHLQLADADFAVQRALAECTLRGTAMHAGTMLVRSWTALHAARVMHGLCCCAAATAAAAAATAAAAKGHVR
jgi:hypothetical protein